MLASLEVGGFGGRLDGQLQTTTKSLQGSGQGTRDPSLGSIFPEHDVFPPADDGADEASLSLSSDAKGKLQDDEHRGRRVTGFAKSSSRGVKRPVDE